MFGALPINLEPEVVLTIWKVYEVDSDKWPGKTRHFVGNMSMGRDGSRCSSEIKVFDHKKRYGITRSGRVYHLKGEIGEDPHAESLFKYWCEMNSIIKIVDVSNEYARPKKNKAPARKNRKTLGTKPRSKAKSTDF